MSSRLTQEDIAAFQFLLSEPRLRPFRALTSSDEDAILLHQASMELSAVLMSVTGVLEIAIRNVVCAQISTDFGNIDFPRAKIPGIIWHENEGRKINEAILAAQRAAYSKLDNLGKSILDQTAFPAGVPANTKQTTITRKRQATLQVSTGQIISQLTIYFWKHLFSENYEPTLWKRSLTG